jgi:hypothetical protein
MYDRLGLLTEDESETTDYFGIVVSISPELLPLCSCVSHTRATHV